MAQHFDKGNFGDSARNKPEWELLTKNSNHVFDGAGENIQYHSDSESLGSRKSKTRYINPAIFVETVEASHSVTSLQTDSVVDDVTPHPHSTYRSNSTPFLSGRDSDSSSSIKRKSCRLPENLAINTDENHVDDETPRFSRTYREDGADTFRLSVASVSTTTTAKEERERNEKKKQDAFKQWLARKEQERKDKLRQEKTKRPSGPTISQQQREESFRRWMERKRTQTERRRADEIMRRYQDNERLERERAKKEREKEEKLNEWIRKKEEEMKCFYQDNERLERERAKREREKVENLTDWIRKKEGEIKSMKTREERRAARAAIEEERRRSKGERAYRDWLRTSKNKPLPVPLNQGELSMRGSVSQMYINPIPWQSPT